MISFHAAFLSLPPSNTLSPVNTRFKGVRISTMDRLLPNMPPAGPASVDGLLLGIGPLLPPPPILLKPKPPRLLPSIGEAGGVELRRPVRDEPKYDVAGRGEDGDIANEPDDNFGLDGSERSCSMMSFVCVRSVCEILPWSTMS
jgi:hypothetical protein